MINVILVAVFITLFIVTAISLKLFFGKRSDKSQPEFVSSTSGGCGCGGCGCGGGGGQK
jgi:hypothetical protein